MGGRRFQFAACAGYFLCGALVLASCGRNSDLRQSSPTEAAIPVGIVYARWTDEGTEILWRKPMAQDEVVLYASSSWGIIPDELGYLPSPDGKWLLVWDTEESYTPSDGDQSTTRWLVIRLADGKQLEIGKVPGKAWLLPYWQDSQHLLFMGVPEETASFDLKTSTLSGSLEKKEMPGVLIGERAKLRLVEYFRLYYKQSWQQLESALKRLERQLGLREYYSHVFVAKEPREYLVLRTLGIPGQRLLKPYIGDSYFVFPSITFSPDYSLIARSYALESEGAVQDGTTGMGFHLQIFEVSSGKTLWSIEFSSKSNSLAKRRAFGDHFYCPYTTPLIQDPRFSTDGRYLAFTTSEEDVGSGYIVRIVDTADWQEVLRLHNATNAFVIP